MKYGVAVGMAVLAVSAAAFGGTVFTAAPSGDSGRVSPGLVDPGASRVIDRNDLTNKLTGVSDVGNQGPASAGERLREITARMEQSGSRLMGKDAGHQTQELQSRIIASLDSLIEELKKREGGGSSKKPSPTGTGGSARAQPGELVQGGGTTRGGNSPAGTSDPKAGSAAPPALSEELREFRTQPMNLPFKERGEIINGLNHGCLPEYESMVRRYYEAFAELGKVHENP